MSFKTAIIALCPPWLSQGNAGALMRTFGGMLDSLNSQLRLGIKYRFPEYAPDDALRYVGNDRNFEQGPVETNNGYRTRLVGAIDANKRRGTAGEILRQLAGYFSGLGQPAMRLVSNSAVWHEYNWDTGLITKTNVGTNWNWDGFTTRWHRGWAILDAALGNTPTYRASAADGNTTGANPAATITTVAGDLLVVFCVASVNSNDAPTCTDTDGRTYTLLEVVPYDTSANRLSVFVADTLVTTASSATVTVTVGSNTSAEVAVVAVAGLTLGGTKQIRSRGSQTNRSAATTPAPVLSYTTKTTSLTITAVANLGTPTTGVSVPASWTSRQDAGQATPNVALRVATRNSGFVGTTITWGSTSSTNYASYALEICGGWVQPALICGDLTGGVLDDGLLCGCSGIKEGEVQAIQRLVQRWKPANVYVNRIIAVFDSSLYERTDSSPTNPNADHGSVSNWSANAVYWLGGGEDT